MSAAAPDPDRDDPGHHRVPASLVLGPPDPAAGELSSLEDQGLVLDVAVHVGSLAAVVIFFWRDVAEGGGRPWPAGAGARGEDTQGARLALGLVIATIPVIIAGAILKYTGMIEALRSVAVIGWTMIGFGILPSTGPIGRARRKRPLQGGPSRMPSSWASGRRRR